MIYKVIVTDCDSEMTSLFVTCSPPIINYCGGYLGITGMKGFIKIGSNFRIEVKEVKDKDNE